MPESFDAADALIEESDAITAATGYSTLGYATALIPSWRGNLEVIHNYVAWGLENARSRGEGRAVGGQGHMLAICTGDSAATTTRWPVRTVD
jgi:hypothetical protein